jgi:hypothetical protein
MKACTAAGNGGRFFYDGRRRLSHYSLFLIRYSLFSYISIAKKQNNK